jgi:hypothetical protein
MPRDGTKRFFKTLFSKVKNYEKTFSGKINYFWIKNKNSNVHMNPLHMSLRMHPLRMYVRYVRGPRARLVFESDFKGMTHVTD